MKLAFLIFVAIGILMMGFTLPALATVQVESTTHTYTNGSNTVTLSHVVGSSSNRLLVVGVSYQNTGLNSPPISSITFNGIALKQAVHASDGVHTASDIWYLKNPARGTHNVVVKFANSQIVEAVVGATSLYGVDQTTPIGNTGFNSNAGLQPIVSLTMKYNNSMIFDDVGVLFDNTISPLTTQTEAWNMITPLLDITGAASYKNGATAGNPDTMQWTNPQNDRWSAVAVEIKAH